MKTIFTSFAIIICILSICNAQNQNNVWLFGDNAGLDFNFSPPKAIKSDLVTLEGTASISDPAGHLLFYTNGATIWDRKNNQMPNGSGLTGGESATQAALIVPLPNSCSKYYLFTAEDQEMNGGISYSVIDMCLNEGYGDVISSSKNTLVIDRATEKLTAVLHANGTDIWIITHTRSSNKFYSYLLTSAGLDTNPTISTIGANYASDAMIGPVVASHDGSKIVSAASFHDICQMFDFNNSTGAITNPVNLNPLLPSPRNIYGIEFSPNDKLLYLSSFFTTCRLYQLDLSTNILTTLNTKPDDYHYGALQMGPDKKIYMARRPSQFVDVISQPNVSGTGCQYEEAAIDLLAGTTSLSGLPNFAPYSFFLDSIASIALGNDTTICNGDSLLLRIESNKTCPASLTWDDGSTAHDRLITEPGLYWVDVVSTCNNYRDSILINYEPTPSVSLEDISICSGETAVLDASFPGADYLWSDGSTDSILLVNSSGAYSVRVSNGCASVIDTAMVNVGGSSSITINKDICSGDVFEGHQASGIYRDTFSTQSGCDSIRILNLHVLSCDAIIHYDLEACTAFMFNGTNMDYSEFTPLFPNTLECGTVSAGFLYRNPPQMNKHSCTPGVNGSVAMCVSSFSSCTYAPGNSASIVIEFSIAPQADSAVRFTGLEFFEQAPTNFNWISGDSGPNNYPTLYGIRILKNGTEIFRKEHVSTKQVWNLQSYSFLDAENFDVHSATNFRIELLPYCPTGNAALVSAWDIDELKIFAGCVSTLTPQPIISGQVLTSKGRAVPGVNMMLSEDPAFTAPEQVQNNSLGNYAFLDVEAGKKYFANANKNTQILEGVNTLDLIRIQQHLLGKVPFTTLPQFIAADINRNGNVSATDVIQLRKVILGLLDEFPSNTSWRFGAMPQDFIGSNLSGFNEMHTIQSVNGELRGVDFMGIKIGDVNEDIRLFGGDMSLEERSASVTSLIVPDLNLSPEGRFYIDIAASQNMECNGLQFQLKMDGISFLSLQSMGLPLSGEYYSFRDGILSMSWNGETPVRLARDQVMFRLELVSSGTGHLRDALHFITDRIMPEVYAGNDNSVYALNLKYQDINTKQSISDFELYPSPFHDKLSMKFHLDQSGKALIRFFDVSGKLIFEMAREYESGDQAEQITMENLQAGSGIIYCQLTCNGFTSIQRILKL